MQASPAIQMMSTSLGDVLERIRERGPQLRAVMAVEKRWHLANFYATSGEQGGLGNCIGRCPRWCLAAATSLQAKQAGHHQACAPCRFTNPLCAILMFVPPAALRRLSNAGSLSPNEVEEVAQEAAERLQVRAWVRDRGAACWMDGGAVLCVLPTCAGWRWAQQCAELPLMEYHVALQCRRWHHCRRRSAGLSAMMSQGKSHIRYRQLHCYRQLG